ncbi:MAG: alginate export family protein [Porphyrobacter sp.]|jgi:hypothetical protein|nr:alginate export family protein [Porphyrobacter sp.]
MPAPITPYRLLAILAAATVSAPAVGQTITITPHVDTRLQLETLEQDNLPDSSEALTLRIRSGLTAQRRRWSARIEGQANLALVDNYADGLNGLSDRPIIPDPENLAVYQAFVRYQTPTLRATAGRQEISLDDDRFIGTAPIRQNAQNFDALRMQWSGIAKGKVKVDATYAWSFRPFWGRDGFGSRPKVIEGENVFLNVAAETAIGTLSGFAYIVDLDNENAQGFRLSSQTYGVRLTGKQSLVPGLDLAYLASFARQSDHGRNTTDYTADFVALEAAALHKGWWLGGGLEMLGADRGAVLGSFQTPFSSGVKFLGLAGRFLPTPPDGVRDYYAAISYKPGKLGPFESVTFKAVGHHFTSDRIVRAYGNEVNLLASGKLAGTLVTLRYADYREQGFSADTRRVMVQIERAY